MTMNLKRHSKKTIYRTIRDYGIITVGMLLGAVGLTLFLLPNEITTDGDSVLKPFTLYRYLRWVSLFCNTW